MGSDANVTPPALGGWLRFFAVAQTWREVPPEIATPELESAFTVLCKFKTNPELNALYQSRFAAGSARKPPGEGTGAAGKPEAQRPGGCAHLVDEE